MPFEPIPADWTNQGLFSNSPDARMQWNFGPQGGSSRGGILAPQRTLQFESVSPGDMAQYGDLVKLMNPEHNPSVGGVLGHSFMNLLPVILAAAGGSALGMSGVAGEAAGAGAGTAAGTGLSTLPSSVLSAGEAFGAGAGGSLVSPAVAGAAGGTGSLGATSMFDGLSDFFRPVLDFFSNPSQGTANFANTAGFVPDPSTGLATLPGDLANQGATALTGLTTPGSSSGFSLGDVLTRAGNTLGQRFANDPLLVLSNLAGTIQGLGQANNVQNAGQDPLGPFRASYAAQLAGLTQNPNSIVGMPGYQAGLEAVARREAAGGYRASGNELAALQKYGGQFYNDEVTRLSKLAGFDFSPTQLTAGQQQAEEAASTILRRAMENLGLILRGPNAFSQARP